MRKLLIGLLFVATSAHANTTYEVCPVVPGHENLTSNLNANFVHVKTNDWYATGEIHDGSVENNNKHDLVFEWYKCEEFDKSGCHKTVNRFDTFRVKLWADNKSADIILQTSPFRYFHVPVVVLNAGKDNYGRDVGRVEFYDPHIWGCVQLWIVF